MSHVTIPLTDKLRAELRAEIGRNNITQRELARRLGWPQSRVTRMVRAMDVNEQDLEEMAAHLGTTVSRLLAAAGQGGEP